MSEGQSRKLGGSPCSSHFTLLGCSFSRVHHSCLLSLLNPVLFPSLLPSLEPSLSKGHLYSLSSYPESYPYQSHLCGVSRVLFVNQRSNHHDLPYLSPLPTGQNPTSLTNIQVPLTAASPAPLPCLSAPTTPLHLWFFPQASHLHVSHHFIPILGLPFTTFCSEPPPTDL